MDPTLCPTVSPNQQRGVPQNNSQNKRPLWEALVEVNPPPYSDLKMTSRGPAWTPNHPTQDDPYEAISPAGGSAGPLAGFVGTIWSGSSLATLLAWVALSPSEGQSSGLSTPQA
ncbi:hypothetical protein E2C01_058708 [Portunus trituberculatus]|uniref:Uncharacterized protein n=1 Tax=Portunus trituberculatus TaxID=210409 RepID=A0A5B7GWA3_PORTR|nr:hypothetical protein [Portunus trituberculatus]